MTLRGAILGALAALVGMPWGSLGVLAGLLGMWEATWDRHVAIPDRSDGTNQQISLRSVDWWSQIGLGGPGICLTPMDHDWNLQQSTRSEEGEREEVIWSVVCL